LTPKETEHDATAAYLRELEMPPITPPPSEEWQSAKASLSQRMLAFEPLSSCTRRR